MAETILYDTPELTVYHDKPAPGVETHRVVAKPGSQGANRDDLLAKATQALAANDTYLAIGTPTNAQVATQVQRLTKECSALIRLLLWQIDSTSGT